MFRFDMSVSQNCAVFYDADNVVLVDSFDNLHFDVRMGTIFDSKPIGQIKAYSDDELNDGLYSLVKNKYEN